MRKIISWIPLIGIIQAMIDDQRVIEILDAQLFLFWSMYQAFTTVITIVLIFWEVGIL